MLCGTERIGAPLLDALSDDYYIQSICPSGGDGRGHHPALQNRSGFTLPALRLVVSTEGGSGSPISSQRVTIGHTSRCLCCRNKSPTIDISVEGPHSSLSGYRRSYRTRVPRRRRVTRALLRGPVLSVVPFDRARLINPGRVLMLIAAR